MFLDDDISFKSNAFNEMKKFIINDTKNYFRYAFNIIDKSNESFYENLKKSLIIEKLGIYNKKLGKVTSSG